MAQYNQTLLAKHKAGVLTHYKVGYSIMEPQYVACVSVPDAQLSPCGGVCVCAATPWPGQHIS